MATDFGKNLTYQQDQNLWGYEVHQGERKNYENPDNDSNNCGGVTAHGARPASGAATDAGAD